ncbi:hypothetical protein [Mameliella sediminis]|uniref:hypothetical protein n=1 Tax=Mameliella sediminis TaxID=2836866 RepID=UPI001C481F38|nr:hypothetical protein [Mameliella sediminis]MBV7396614.1 hypothetical protein [Mameliella sediminis]
MLVLLTVLVTLDEWRLTGLSFLLPVLVVLLVALMAGKVARSRQGFILAAVLLTAVAAATLPGWQETILRGFASAAFIGAFFAALTTLRNVAETSPAIRAAGSFLAEQPPGRRYAALTVGSHLFALLLNYGAISLLGALATTSAAREANAEIRRHRIRRMLLAIQRGFISSLPWSPLGFSMAITNALIPGARWAESVVAGVGTSAIILVSGWALDTIFKPRLTVPSPPRGPVEGSWRLLRPLLLLLVLLGVTVAVLHEETGLRIVGIVMLVVPALSLGWVLIQHRGGGLDFSLRSRLHRYVTVELPGARGEVTLLMMAGYIGTVGGPLLGPVVAGAGIDLAALPTWVVLIGLVWLVPVLGQLGMNPILAVTLFAPVIPAPEVLGVAPAAVVAAIAAGWAISGLCSPFTATTLLIGSFGNVSALHVGLRWNGVFVAVLGVLLSVWVLVFAFALG